MLLDQEAANTGIRFIGRSNAYDDDDDDKKAFASSSALDFIVICDVNASFFTQAIEAAVAAAAAAAIAEAVGFYCCPRSPFRVKTFSLSFSPRIQ